MAKCGTVLRALLLFIMAIAVSADLHSAYDCKMRTLAVEFAQHIQPFRSPKVFADIVDALNGSPEKPQDCVVSAPRPTEKSSTSRFVQPQTIASRGGITVYVDSVKGSDHGNGTLSGPFKSIPAAVAATRASPGGYDSIVLRSGTLYNSPTVVLTPEDEGLTVQAYPGEEVWVSGGKLLTGLNWKPYNVTKKETWFVVNNTNCVAGSPPHTEFVKKTNTWQGCEALCKANYTAGGVCQVWTWHDANTGQFAFDCYFRTDGLWKPIQQGDHVSGYVGGQKNIWMASLAGKDISSVPGLRFNNTRLIRARYPNANPETDGFLAPAVFRAKWTPQQAPRRPDVQIDLPASTLLRNNTVSYFQTFTAGIGGTCKRFQPDAGYWCSQNVQGGGSEIYYAPIAMQAGKDVLPNSPYAHPKGAIIQTWRPGHWASWMYEVTDAKTTNGITDYSIYGGFQGSRGANEGEDTYIENVFEELDSPSEYFYNESTQILYLFFNTTIGTPPPADGLIVTSTKHLFNITGTQKNPVKDISITGIGLRDTAYTYMDPHSIPSGGDWTLERSAVVFLEGTEGITISGCVFERIDGNAILLSAYNRNASIVYNEFAWIGATAVAFWGNTDGGDPRLPPGYGYDGSHGNQPRHNLVAYNLCRELGIWEKQSSCYTQFKSSENNIINNIFYNGPRAHVNYNDGFRGGARLSRNLIFNSCRESGDHGPFNSWDRDPYLADYPGTGQITTTKAMDEISYNFILANYNSLGPIDNDDGGSYYHTHHNFFVYGGGGLKNDFEGHDNWWTDNIIALMRDPALHNGYNGIVGTPGKAPYVLNGHVQRLVGNVIAVFNSPQDTWVYSRPICAGTGKTIEANNTIFTADSNKIVVCDMSLSKWISEGNDQGTTAHNSPENLDDLLIKWGRGLLWTSPEESVVAKLY